MHLLLCFKHKLIPGYDYLPLGHEQVKRGVIYVSDVKVAMRELLRRLRMGCQQRPAGQAAGGTGV